MVARGEVWWCDEPNRARRPYLVLTRDEAIPRLNQVLAVPATTRVRGIPTEVTLTRADGMPVECVLALDGTTVVRKALCTERITQLGPNRVEAVCEALRIAAGC